MMTPPPLDLTISPQDFIQNTHKLSFDACSPWLAPLAGFSDLAFRLLCRRQGAAVACTEMVSAKGLVFGAQHKALSLDSLDGSARLLLTCEEDQPLVVQLFGAEPEYLKRALEILLELGYKYFDLNMGCSVPKVAKTGAGSALLADPDKAFRVAQGLLSYTDASSVGFKMRLGWARKHDVFLELGQALQEAGASWLCLHPRYAQQAFTGEADYEKLYALKKVLSIPLIASGDLFSAEDAFSCLQKTGTDTVMFARGAITNPFIFSQLIHKVTQAQDKDTTTQTKDTITQTKDSARQAKDSAPQNYDLEQLIKEHAFLLRDIFGEKKSKRGEDYALNRVRIVAPRYCRHMEGAAILRKALATCFSWDELFDTLELFFSRAEVNKNEHHCEHIYEDLN